jgi:hypothetical protein
MRKSAGKVMTSVLWDRKDVLLDLMEKGTTVNAASYCATLERLRVAIQRQRTGLLTIGVLLLHDNDVTVTQLLQRFRWTPMEHPPHRQDLAPSDYYFLLAVKDYLSGHHTAQIWCRVIFTSVQMLRIIFLATNLDVMTT